MGGSCSSYEYSGSRGSTRTVAAQPRRALDDEFSNCNCGTEGSSCDHLRTFLRTGERESIILPYRAFFSRKKNGFFVEIAKAAGLKNIADTPKEFPDIEYEIKFDVSPQGKGTEPTVIEYMDAFDYPVGPSVRFIKDPVNAFAVGVNHFYGDSLDERLVVIEKAGKTFMKEKGLVEPTKTGVPFEGIVIKRTEIRYEASMEQILKKTEAVRTEPGVEYRGRVRKEKGDFFVMDLNDGRVYSMSFTRAHLTRPGEKKESGIQRQLEMEYAGYMPGFANFERDSEKQIVQGMVDLAKYTYALYQNAPVKNGWRMNLELTGERKYDFIIGKKQALPERRELLSLSETSVEKVKTRR